MTEQEPKEISNLSLEELSQAIAPEFIASAVSRAKGILASIKGTPQKPETTKDNL